jgi:hypothetical protein
VATQLVASRVVLSSIELVPRGRLSPEVHIDTTDPAGTLLFVDFWAKMSPPSQWVPGGSFVGDKPARA